MRRYRPLTRFLLPLLVLAGIHAGAAAADRSCRAELGEQRAAQLVRQCRLVSPATHPPCNAANSCRMIEDEILRGCGFGTDGTTPFCDAPVRDGTFEGVLVAGGGIDDDAITVRRDDGNRVRIYCGEACGDWFDAVGEGDERRLKPAYAGRRVAVTVKTERNGGRIAGPDAGERLPFAKAVRLVR